MSKIQEVAAELFVGMDRIPFVPVAVAMDSVDEAAMTFRLAAGGCPGDATELRTALALLEGVSRNLVHCENALHEAREMVSRYGATVLCAGNFVNLPDDTPRQPIRAGGEEDKSLVTAVVDAVPRSFMWRSFDARFVENAVIFERAGLLAPRRPLIAPDGGILVDDVKADGSEVYGYSLAHAIAEDMPNERARPNIDPTFIRYMDSSTVNAQIKAALDEYASRATVAGIQLNDATPELILRPDGSWAWIVLDLGGANWCRVPTTAEGAENIALVNRGTARIAFLGLERTVDYLRDNVRTPGIA